MKKILPVLSLVILAWSCAKKMTPSQSETPASNTGSVINSGSKPAEAGGSSGAISSTTAAKSAPVEAKDRSPQEQAAISGQATFNAKCGKCHGLKPAQDYTATRWAQILAVMAPKANLTEDERNNVYEYVKANSKK